MTNPEDKTQAGGLIEHEYREAGGVCGKIVRPAPQASDGGYGVCGQPRSAHRSRLDQLTQDAPLEAVQEPEEVAVKIITGTARWDYMDGAEQCDAIAAAIREDRARVEAVRERQRRQEETMSKSQMKRLAIQRAKREEGFTVAAGVPTPPSPEPSAQPDASLNGLWELVATTHGAHYKSVDHDCKHCQKQIAAFQDWLRRMGR